MKLFKKFFEDDRMAIVPQSGMPFEAFMETFEGWTIQKIIDRSTYINLYIGNKYGTFGDAPGAEGAAQAFVEKLVRFVNQDIMKFRPRVYETDEFKQAHNYDEYQSLDKQRRHALKDRFTSRHADDKKALAKATAAYDAVTAQISNTEWMNAWRKARDAEDQGVKDFHNTPLTKEDLSDDGSEEYAQLKQAYEVRLDYTEQAVDEDDGYLLPKKGLNPNDVVGKSFRFHNQVVQFTEYVPSTAGSSAFSKPGDHVFNVKLANSWSELDQGEEAVMSVYQERVPERDPGKFRPALLGVLVGGRNIELSGETHELVPL